MNKEQLLSQIEMYIKVINTLKKIKENTLFGREFDSYDEIKKEVEKKYNEQEKIIKQLNDNLEKIIESEKIISDSISNSDIKLENLLEKIEYCNNKTKIYFDLLRLRTFINNFFKKYLGLKCDILKIDIMKLEERINSYFNIDHYKKELKKTREILEILKDTKKQISKLKTKVIKEIQYNNCCLLSVKTKSQELCELYKKKKQYLFVKENLNIIISKIQQDKVLGFYDLVYIELENNIDLIYKIIKVLQMLPNYKKVLSFIEDEGESQIIIDFIIDYTIYGDEFNKIIKKRKKLKCF